MKVLYVSNIVGTIESFLIPHLRMLKKNGCIVDIACNINHKIDQNLIDATNNRFNIDFERKLFSLKNIKTISKIKELVVNQKYDIVHTHTPIASFLVRFACRNIPNVKIYYTVHGFHFYKGAKLLNRTIYKFIETIAARWTDVIITMNEEDYNYSLKLKSRSNLFFYMDGVGINLNKFTNYYSDSKTKLKEKYGYNDNDFILINVARQCVVKNQYQILKSINLLKKDIPNLKLLMVGEGPKLNEYKDYVNKNNLNNIVQFLGYRNDIPQLLAISDILLTSAKQEGLPVNIMEAFAIGIPVVATNCRGNRDLIINDYNGYLVEIDNIESYRKCIKQLYLSPKLRSCFSMRSSLLIKKYEESIVVNQLKEIYIMNGMELKENEKEMEIIY